MRHYFRFPTYPLLLPSDAVALVRAARLYQDALWIAEAEPELAWLFLVSALEISATVHRIGNVNAVEALELWKPQLAKLLTQRGIPNLLQDAAASLLPLAQATKRFIDFVIQFLPSPPNDRLHENLQFKWETSAMKRALSKIYEHRSVALHAGTPFPKPMSEPPQHLAEIPFGLAYSAYGGVWVKDDIPMLLHTFEYLTQGVLLNWWKTLLAKSKD